MARDTTGPELSGSHPEPATREITRTRVWAPDGGNGILLLTDVAGRSFPIFVGRAEASAIRPWLADRGTIDDPDLHTTLLRALRGLGARVESVAVSDLKAGTFHGTLRLVYSAGPVELDCRPSDGLNLAARAGAPVSAAEHVIAECVLKRKDGEPASPRWAWHLTCQQLASLSGGGRGFADVAELLKALEQTPDDRACRNALHELVPGVCSSDPAVRNPAGGLAALEAWVARCEGSPLAATAAGLLGAVYLCPPDKRAGQALPHLEKAYSGLSGDARIAFDLATAYALLDRTDEALDLIAEWPAAKGLFTQSGNFSTLWSDPRFIDLVGEPEREAEGRYTVAQLDHTSWRSRSGGPRARVRRGMRIVGGVGKVVDTGPLAVAGIGRRRLREIEKASGAGPLLRVEHVVRAPRFVAGPALAFGLRVEQTGDIELPLRDPGGQLALMAAQLIQLPRPMTHALFCDAVRAVGAKVEAGALGVEGRRRPTGLLVLRHADGRHVVPVEAGGATAVTLEAGAPLLVSERLARVFAHPG